MFCCHLLALVGGDLSQVDQVNFVCHQHHRERLSDRKQTTHRVRTEPSVAPEENMVEHGCFFQSSRQCVFLLLV